MKILFLAYYFPPIKSIALLRVWQWSRHLLPFVDKVFVITTKNRQILAKEERPTEGVEIYEARTFDYRTLAAKRHPNTKSVHFDEQKKASFLMQIFIKLKNTIPFNFFIGEGGFLYTLSSVYIGYQLIKKHKIRYIISSFPPYSDHYSAWILKLIFRKKIVWIADYRDPHINPIFKWYFGLKFQRWANWFLMSQADMLTTVSDGLKSILFPFNPNVYTIRNSFNCEILNTHKDNIYLDKFCIAYTGSMYQHQNPALLFEVLNEIFDEYPTIKNSLQIIYAGKDSHTWKVFAESYQLAHILVLKGNLTMHEAIDIQRKSHVNLLLTPASTTVKGLLGGKLCEYLAARRPIIALINGVQDPEFEEIMQHTEGGIVVYHQQKESHLRLKNFLLQLFYTWKENPDKLPFIPAHLLTPFTWTYQIETFLNSLPSKK